MFRFGLENRRGEYFRNVGLTYLLPTPTFYNFLIGHKEASTSSVHGDASEECLTCMFQDVARHYYPAVGGDRATLYTKLDDFFKQCHKEF